MFQKGPILITKNNMKYSYVQKCHVAAIYCMIDHSGREKKKKKTKTNRFDPLYFPSIKIMSNEK